MSFLPATAGLLPKWLLFVSALSFYNVVQCFLTTSNNRRIYNRAPQQVTPLFGRMFAVWTLLSGLIRLYAAYNLESRDAYLLAMLTFVLAFAHFSSEIFVFGTSEFGNGGVVGATFVVASVSTVWMGRGLLEGWYVR